MEHPDYGSPVLSAERDSQVCRFLIQTPTWIARDLELTPDKIEWIWQEFQMCKTLLNDFNRRKEVLVAGLINESVYWIEVINVTGNTVGLISLELNRFIDGSLNFYFFDRQIANKVDICALVLDHLFRTFPGLHRITVMIPDIYHATIRLLRRLRFSREGMVRESQLIGGRWVNEVVYGILASEVLNVQPKRLGNVQPFER
jgi:RimJ/RimL family protein N-acetyltransferase